MGDYHINRLGGLQAFNEAGAAHTVNKTGEQGVVVTTNTVAVVGGFCAVQIIADAVFSEFTEVGATGQSMVGISLPAGMVIFGTISGYTLASGAVRAYKA